MINQNYIKEKYLNNSPASISFDILNIIIKQKEKCFCKINCNNGGSGTGFFCLIPFPDKLNRLPVLITNNHILEKDDISKGKKIIFSINEGKEQKEIIIDDSRKTYTNEEFDVTIIEMKKNDDLNFNKFLEIDENIDNDNIIDFYKQKSIYLIYYSSGLKALYSNGIIQNIDINLCDIEHLCSTDPGASGCPIINLNNNRVLAIHKGADKENNWNLGTFIKKPIENFYEEYINKIINKNSEIKEEKNNEINHNEQLKNDDFKIEYLPENYPNDDLSFKIVVLGSSGKIFYIILYLKKKELINLV